MTRLVLRSCAAGAVLLLSLAVAHAQQPSGPRVLVSLNAGAQATSTDFTRVSTVPANREDGTLTSGYRVDPGIAFDLGAAVLVRRQLWVGAAISRFSTSGDVAVTAQVPHPFFFNQSRRVEGTPSDLSRGETAAHVSLMWELAPAGRWQIRVLGGPSFFSVRQDLVTTVQITETYPFDVADYAGADTTESSGSGVGFHAAADLSTNLSPTVGVGVLLRYSRGEVTLGNAPAVSVTTGGASVAGGLRVRF